MRKFFLPEQRSKPPHVNDRLCLDFCDAAFPKHTRKNHLTCVPKWDCYGCNYGHGCIVVVTVNVTEVVTVTVPVIVAVVVIVLVTVTVTGVVIAIVLVTVTVAAVVICGRNYGCDCKCGWF